MKTKFIALVAAGVAALAAMPATAQNGRVYMTGTSNPWGETTNDAAMDSAFGAGSWTKFLGFDASVLNANNRFIFFDGSDGNGQQFAGFVNANRAAIESFVTAGGRVFSNMASNNGPNTVDLGFGTTSNYGAFSETAALTAEGLAAGLDANGAGSAWTGTSFGHNTVSGGTCYTLSNLGCVFAGGTQGSGAFFTGGQTTTNFHSTGGYELRVNQLRLVDTLSAAAGVPEPAAWAMMIGGFGLVGGAMRRRRVATTVSFA